ncbi:MAG: MFS transporter [Deltaproteobacteria bacterium]|nr:MFS transporter [Deltaproteobacteria bacterium]MDQ3298172.1 MFS transporter [Myxococcota bacterium]
MPPSLLGASRRQWAELDRRVWQMALARSINTMGLSLVMSFLAIYVVGTRGYPAWLYGVIALGANLGQSLSSAWAGNLSDRIGRLPLISSALFVRSVFIALLGTQILLHAPLWTLAANMMVTSALRGCFEPVAYALVADVVRDDQRIAAFGLQRMGTNLGWTFGPALGGLLTLVMPYGAVFYVAAAGMIAAGFVTLRMVDPISRADAPTAEHHELRGALAEAVREPAMRALLAGTFLAALLGTQMFSTLAIYLTDELGLTKADVGLLYMINGAGVLILQVPALALIQRFGLARTLPWSSLLDAIAFALIGAASGFTGAAVAMIAVTAAEVVFNPAHQTAIAETADPAHRGRAYGLTGFVQMIGIAMAPLLGGVLFDTIGDHHAALWLTIATIGLAQTACFIAFVRHRRARTIAAASPTRQV